MKIDDIKEKFDGTPQTTQDCVDILKKYSVQFCQWILDIKDPELKKEKDPNKLFDKYLESL
jgi:hypothetical protein